MAPRYDWPSELRTGAGELPVGQLEAVPLRGVLERAQVVVADLVAQPARAGVDQHGELTLNQPHHLGRDRVVDAVDDLDLEEMVARPRACRTGHNRAGSPGR